MVWPKGFPILRATVESVRSRYMYVYVCVCMCMYVLICMYAGVSDIACYGRVGGIALYVCVCVSMYLLICMCVCMYVCMQGCPILRAKYTHTHTHITCRREIGSTRI